MSRITSEVVSARPNPCKGTWNGSGEDASHESQAEQALSLSEKSLQCEGTCGQTTFPKRERKAAQKHAVANPVGDMSPVHEVELGKPHSPPICHTAQAIRGQRAW